MAKGRQSALRKARRTAAADLRACESPASGPFTAEERAALAFFSVEGVGPVTLKQLKEKFGSLAEAFAAGKSQLLPVLRDAATRKRFSEIADPGALADKILADAERVGARVLFPGRPGWPRQLVGLDFPPVLYVRGNLDPEQKRVGLVGSRETDLYGAQLSSFFSAGLCQAGVCVVSGGALGVDAAAHRAALDGGGSTVAVLGSGIDRAYPGEHVKLFKEIAAGAGAVVSHLPPGTPAVPQNFQVRNRLIAGLCDAVVVVRAAASSGSLGTAAAVRHLGRPLFAVPGDVTCKLATGVNALLEREHAKPLVGLAPIAKVLGLSGERWPSAAYDDAAPAKKKRPSARSEIRPVPELSTKRTSKVKAEEIPEELREVYRALAPGPCQFDELMSQCRLDAAGLANALLRLEVMGLCEERVGKVFARR